MTEECTICQTIQTEKVKYEQTHFEIWHQDTTPTDAIIVEKPLN